MEATSSTRWHGLDLLRLLCYFCIVEFHFGLFYFGEPSTGHVESSFIIAAVDDLGHLLMISGFVIAFLSTLLLALNRNNKTAKWRIFGVIALGWAVLSLSSGSDLWVTWDVFGLLFVGMASAMIAERLGMSALRLIGSLGYLLLWLPIWQLGPYLPAGFETLKHVFGVADCQGAEVAEWPLFPWIGLIWFGYWVGAELRRLRDTDRLDTLKIKPLEAVTWVILLGFSTPQLGAYTLVRMGQYFACDAYRQPPFIFWSHFVWALAIIRCSFDSRIQDYLARKKWALRISSLAISRKFWLAYVLQYVYGNMVAGALNAWGEVDPDSFGVWELPVLEFMALTIVPQNEFMTARASLLLQRLGTWWRTRRRALTPSAASSDTGGST